MTLRRRRLWVLALIGFVLAGIAFIWLYNVSLSTKWVEKIEIGMTKSQVISLLGRPSDCRWENQRREVDYEQWDVSDGFINVRFNDDDRVIMRSAQHDGL